VPRIVQLGFDMVPLWLRHAQPQLGCDCDILIVNYCHKRKQCILFVEHVHALHRVTSGLSYAPTDLFPANVACYHQCWLVLYSHDLCMTAAWNLACMTFGHEPQICVCVDTSSAVSVVMHIPTEKQSRHTVRCHTQGAFANPVGGSIVTKTFGSRPVEHM